MRAIVIHAAGDLRIEDCPQESPGPGQVSVAMKAGGICGSDLHYYRNGGFGPVRLREPMILGHEVAGEVSALGDGVDNLKIGDLVAVSPSRPCQACEYCLRGQQNHCENMRFYGSAMPFPHIQGAFCEHLVADAAQCVRAKGLTPAQAAMAEPLAVCLHAVGRARDLVGRCVLVTGCGPIGCLAVLAARRAGAGRIIATDLADFPLQMARRCGADVVLNTGADGDALAEYQHGKGQIDVHIECAGVAGAVAAGIAVLRPKGVLVQVGIGGDMAIPMQALTAKEISLRGAFRFHPEFATAVKMMQDGLIDVQPLITHSFALEQAAAAFEMAGDRSQAIKAQIAF